MSQLAEQWTQQMAGSSAGSPSWMGELRGAGAAAFAKAGLPHRKVEDWKYTSLKLLEGRGPALLAEYHGESDSCVTRWPHPLVEHTPCVRLVNGVLDSELPLPEGLQVLRLAESLDHPDHRGWVRAMLESLEMEGTARAFSALNTAMLGPGLVIHVPAGCEAGDLLLHWGFSDYVSTMLCSSRVLIRIEEGASLRLIEQFESGDEIAHALNLLTQVRVGRGARFNQVRVQQESMEAALITRTECEVLENGHYQLDAFDWGGGLVRADTRPRLTGTGARADVNGAFVLNGSQHLDHHVFVDHVADQTVSRQFFRGVLGGHSRGVFNGKARICQGADGSSVRQSNANLLLSPMAEMDTKPELEIYADEIEASHGATVGQLDEDAVFYLRSRGLAENDARALLTSAFCKSVLDRVAEASPSLVEAIATRMDTALETIQRDE